MIIGITGLNGSGKDTVAEYLVRKYTFSHHSLSDFIREKLKSECKELTRENLLQKGNLLRQKHGPSILAKLAFEKCQQKNCVLTSIRNPKEVLFLKKQKHFMLWNIAASASIRFQRAKARQKESEKNIATLAEFLTQEKQELRGDINGQNLKAVIKLSDLTIDNNQDKNKLERKINEAYQSIPASKLG